MDEQSHFELVNHCLHKLSSSGLAPHIACHPLPLLVHLVDRSVNGIRIAVQLHTLQHHCRGKQKSSRVGFVQVGNVRSSSMDSLVHLAVETDIAGPSESQSSNQA